ncbi:oligopeptide/dipeptide ABC transporter ATP-binding protein [uncultured Negativibacillus sp.]|uniref:ABC transporter ATP-binding protein n=1 Tax=uncultured Negativibacillus sp. TaxID=1980696 RepID=UPI0025EC37D1|nr:oligopeptide/dipeptide ABC transporter ATP-binding protein [uncultured Negativibacillus sp.]
MGDKKPILEVKHLKKYFPVDAKHTLKAVDDVSFTIYEGETLGIVGESGCGKTTCGRTCIGVYEATSGEVLYKGKDINKMTAAERKEFTKKVQMIFQDPYSSLDPRMKVHDIIAEGMQIHKLVSSKAEEIKAVQSLLEQVGLNPEHASRYVHEFSGGQRQRIGIARALAVNPEFLMCDEPISALDVSVQAQVVNLLVKLQKERGLTCMFIAHDLSMVKHISDRVGVMYLGNLVELADSDALYQHPLHPYTKALLSAIPVPDPDIERQRNQIRLEGEVPSPMNPPAGCHFCNRCSYAMEECSCQTPVMREVEPGHFVACHLYDEMK